MAIKITVSSKGQSFLDVLFSYATILTSCGWHFCAV